MLYHDMADVAGFKPAVTMHRQTVQCCNLHEGLIGHGFQATHYQTERTNK
jgi:hypothetical protein